MLCFHIIYSVLFCDFWNREYHTGQCLRRIAGGNVDLPLDTT